MGELRFFDLTDTIKAYNLEVFIETGTGRGGSVDSILEYNCFTKIYSIEINYDLYKECADRFKNLNNVQIINSSSYEGLEKLLPQIPKNQNVLFWLDAHFPGADFNLADYSTEKETSLRIPLESELELIHASRKDCKDVFIIDDLRIYEDGPYEGGNWHRRVELGGNGIDFITEKYQESHSIYRDFHHQGYLFLIPK